MTTDEMREFAADAKKEMMYATAQAMRQAADRIDALEKQNAYLQTEYDRMLADVRKLRAMEERIDALCAAYVPETRAMETDEWVAEVVKKLAGGTL